jgi:hypothetical protein
MLKPTVYILQVFLSLTFLIGAMAFTVVVAKASFVSSETVMKVLDK